MDFVLVWMRVLILSSRSIGISSSRASKELASLASRVPSLRSEIDVVPDGEMDEISVSLISDTVSWLRASVTLFEFLILSAEFDIWENAKSALSISKLVVGILIIEITPFIFEFDGRFGVT